MSTLSKYYQFNTVTGVNIHLEGNGDATIAACEVSLSGSQLQFEKQKTGIRKVEELREIYPAKALVALNITGRGVLYKQVEKLDKIKAENFKQILPGADINDFYVQNFISGDQSFITIIRKADADRWIEHLRLQNLVPLMLSLGPFIVQHVIGQLNFYGEELKFNGHHIRLSPDRNWASYKSGDSISAEHVLKIESQTMDERVVIPYAAAFQLILSGRLDVIKAHLPDLDIAFHAALNRKKLKVNVSVILIVFFFLLLVNFVLFTWLNSANARLQDQASRFTQSTNDLEQINDQVRMKEALLKNLGWNARLNKAILIDQLASLLPPEISWKAAAVDPVDIALSRTQKSLQFADHQIRIVGSSQQILPVNEWIARIKTRPWVKNVQMESYTYNSEINSGLFTLIIQY